jgi:hypothetical protein
MDANERHMRMLYGTDAAGYANNMKPGADATPEMFEGIRLGESGDLDRCDQFITHLAGLHRTALRMRDAMQREREVARDVDDPVGAGNG